MLTSLLALCEGGSTGHQGIPFTGSVSKAVCWCFYETPWCSFNITAMQPMMTLSNGNTFYLLLALCEENPPVSSWFPSQRPVTQSFDVYSLCLKKRLSKRTRHQWFEMPSHSLWHHCNAWPPSLGWGDGFLFIIASSDAYSMVIVKGIMQWMLRTFNQISKANTPSLSGTLVTPNLIKSLDNTN